MRVRGGGAAAVIAAMLWSTSAAAAQEPVPPPAPDAPDPVVRDAKLDVPKVVAPGGRVVVRVRGMQRPVRIEERRAGRWVRRGEPIVRIGQPTTFRAPGSTGQLRVRATDAVGRITRSRRITVRALRLAAVGDINLGNGPGVMIDRFGPAYPWMSVGPRLRAADIAFGNLECAISLRGTAQDKQFTFRGRPSALQAAATTGGLDVVNLANNHSGDFGRLALLDTLRYVRRFGMVAVGAGATETQAYRPVVVERLGLRVAFVGFGNILPFEFRAAGRTPGSAWAFPGRVRDSVRAARRVADVVIATFHWGIERDRSEAPDQRALARAAIDAGATAVIGAHPHVLQPVRRPGSGTLIAYSLGNFVFSAASPGTQNTGILELDLTARGITSDRFLPATIRASRPILRRGARR